MHTALLSYNLLELVVRGLFIRFLYRNAVKMSMLASDSSPTIVNRRTITLTNSPADRSAPSPAPDRVTMDQSDGLAYDQVEAANSIRERTIVENSLVILLQGLHGQVTTVDLRDESTARGRVVNVDAYMNVRLADVLFRDRRGRVSRLEDLFITGRNVRYVHIPDQLDIADTIEKQLGKISRMRNYAGERGSKKKTKK